MKHNTKCMAKRVWLAKINHDAPTPALEAAAPEDQAKRMEALAQQCTSGEATACDALSREDEARAAWLQKLDAPSWGPLGPGRAGGRA